MSNIRDTDLLLVERSGTCYQCQKQNIGNVRDSDLFLIERNGVSYQCRKDAVKSNVRDGDRILIERSGVSYQTTGDQFKQIFGGSWVAANTQPAEVFTGVAFGDGKFIAATATKKFYTSTNGSDWSFLANFPNTQPFTVGHLAYGNGTWVGTGNPDIFSVNTIYSTNGGASWNNGTNLDLNDLNIYDIVFGQGKFVLVGAPLRSNTRSVAVSTNGYTGWNQYAPASAGSWWGITYNPTLDRFTSVAAQPAANGNNTMYTSNPTTWISVSDSQLARRVKYNLNGYVRCYNNHLSHSTNGVNFTTGTGDTVGTWNDVAAGDDGSFMAIGEGSATFSPDGKTWTYAEGLDTNGVWNKIAYGNGVYVTVSYKAASDTTSTRIMTFAP